MRASFLNQILQNCSWPRVSTLLDDTRQQTSCLVCSRPITIFIDHVVGGQQRHCPFCSTTENLFEALSRYWNQSLEASVDKILPLLPWPSGTDESRRQLLQYLHRRREIAVAWHAAAERPNQQVTPNDWLESIGFIRSRSISYGRPNIKSFLLRPAPAELDMLLGKSHRRVLNLLRWSSADAGRLIVFGWYDFPLQLCAIDACLVPAENRVVSLRRQHVRLHSDQEHGGVLIHPTAWQQSGDLYGIGDPELVCRLQTKRLLNEEPPLPLFAWSPTADINKSDWSGLLQLRNKDIVLTGPELSAGLLATAIKLQARIAVVPELGNLKREGHELVRRAESRKRHWRDYLQEALRDWPPAQQHLLAEELRQLYAPDVLLSLVGRDAAMALEALWNQSKLSSTLLFCRRTVRIDSAGWTDDKTEELISNVKIVVQRIINRPGLDPLYTGFIRYADREYPFQAEEADVQEHITRWLRRFCLDHGFIWQHSPEWADRLLSLALRLNPPLVVVGVGQIGWNTETSTFDTANFKLHPGGRTEEIPDTAMRGWPTAELELPDTPASPSLISLFTSEAAASVWGPYVHLLLNILRPVTRGPTTGLVVSDPRASAACRIALESVDGHVLRRPLGDIDHLLQRFQTHAYPTGLQLTDGQPNDAGRIVRQLMEQAEVLNGVMLRLPKMHLATVSLRPGWWLYAVDPLATKPADDLVVAGRHLTPRILRDWLVQMPTATLANFHSLAVWLEKWLFDKFSIETSLPTRGAALLRRQPLTDLVRLLHWAVQHHHTEVRGAGGPSGPEHLVQAGSNLFVPLTILPKLLERHGLINVELSSVLACCNEEGRVKTGENRLRACWIIEERRYARIREEELAAAQRAQAAP